MLYLAFHWVESLLHGNLSHLWNYHNPQHSMACILVDQFLQTLNCCKVHFLKTATASNSILLVLNISIKKCNLCTVVNFTFVFPFTSHAGEQLLLGLSFYIWYPSVFILHHDTKFNILSCLCLSSGELAERWQVHILEGSFVHPDQKATTRKPSGTG